MGVNGDHYVTEQALHTIPTGKTIVFINTPFSYVETPLCPLDIMSVNTLKLSSYLKSLGNTVHFVNMRSRESYRWRDVSAGIDGSAVVAMRVKGKPRRYLIAELQGLAAPPDEIWISCVFTFDYEIVQEMIEVCREICPSATIVLGGDFIRNSTELNQYFKGVVLHSGRIEGADDAPPDFSVMDSWDYGVFQLSMGCPHRCSFCVAGKDTPQALDVKSVVSYMKEFHDRYRPQVFWNWDPNVLVFKEQFSEFLDLFAASGITSKLRFGKGFQPNLMTDELIRKMADTAVIGASLPLESADSATIQRYRKPYSIISSVQVLTRAARYRFDLQSSQCTFIIGYPDDNFSAIFRAYLTVLMLGGKPTPFPIFLFPNSEDFSRYESLVRGKDLSELHGQRWPLINAVDVPKYQNLLRFLLIPDLSQASRNLHLLTPDLLEAYQRERDHIEEFIGMCQAAKEDSVEELRAIESALEARKQQQVKRKTNLLYIVANPKAPEKSITRNLGDYLLNKLQERYGECDVTIIDLYKDKPPFINEQFVEAVFRETTDEPDQETAAMLKKADDYIGLLRKADKIVVVCPMWTFSIPSILKAFFELVTSRLFYYHHQTIEDKPVVCILARHGRYIPAPSDGREWRPKYINAQEPSLISAFQIMGVVKGLRFVCAEGLFVPEKRSGVVEKIKRELDVVAAQI